MALLQFFSRAVWDFPQAKQGDPWIDTWVKPAYCYSKRWIFWYNCG